MVINVCVSDSETDGIKNTACSACDLYSFVKSYVGTCARIAIRHLCMQD